MSEKYSIIFSSQERLCTEGAPLIISARALSKDNETGALIAQVKFHSITGKRIKLVKAEISCLDTMGRPCGNPIIQDYLDLNAVRNQDFGAKTPVKIPNSATRSFNVRVIEVGFEGGEIWTSTDGEWEALPEQKPIESVICDEDTLRGYKAAFGAGAKFEYVKLKDKWLCTCGEINDGKEERCYSCNAALSELDAANAEELRKEGVYLKALELLNENTEESLNSAQTLLESLRDYKDSEALIASIPERFDVLGEKKKKRKFKLILAGIISGAAVVLGLLAYFVAYPFISMANGNYAPYINMYSIEEFEIPEGTTEIKDYAFATINDNGYGTTGCDSLKKVIIPDSVTSIGSSAFSGCTNLTSVVIGKSVKSIGAGAFSSCDSLTSVVIPDSVTSIGKYAFDSCDSLTSVVIPDSVTSIGNSAFNWCRNLTSVTIGNSVKSIGYDAFYGCYKLVEVYNLSSLDITKGSDAYGRVGYYALNVYTPTSGSSKLHTTSDGFVFYEDGNKCYLVGYIGNKTDITLPESYNGKNYEIYDYAFSNCSSLTSVAIPDSVTSIGEDAFFSCDSLTSVVIPDSVTSIGDSAFDCCDSLTSIKYRGTEAQWNAIPKGWHWITGSGCYVTYNYTGK